MSNDIALFEKARTALAAFAEDAACADILPPALRGKPANIALVLHTGHELGVSPMQALRNIHIIEGRTTLSADFMAGLVMASPLCEYLRPVELTAACATYETLRRGWDAPLRVSFTIEDAQRAGLTGKGNWKTYPQAMLKARCLTSIARAAYPDLVMGLYDPDEVDDIPPPRNITAEVIDATPPAEKPKARGLKSKLGDAPPDDTKALQSELTQRCSLLGGAPSQFRTYLTTLAEFAGKDIPPVGQWDVERLKWAVRALDNGHAQGFANYVRPEDPPPAEDAPESDEMPV